MNYTPSGTTKMAEEATAMSDIMEQRQSVHDSTRMLKDAIETLAVRLIPISDTRPDSTKTEETPPISAKWHCDLAELLKTDADALRECLTLVRSITSRLQI